MSNAIDKLAERIERRLIANACIAAPLPERDVIAAELAVVDELVEAAKDAKAHVTELREAWRTGAISERDGKGGTRSNRNVDVEVALRAALADYDASRE